MSGQLIDPFGNSFDIKYAILSARCPLTGDWLNRFIGNTCSIPGNLSNDSMEGDLFIENSASISFSVSHEKYLIVSIGSFSGTVTRVSELPGTDRIIRPSDRKSLPSGQKRFYRKLTEFLNGKKVYVNKTFTCYTALTGATRHDYDIKIAGDRPFPVSVDHSELSLIACPQVIFDTIRDENNIVYHPHGPNMVSIADAGDAVCYFG